MSNAEINVSNIMLGALHFGVLLDEKKSLNLIDQAKDCGFTTIDTGPLYGNGESERIVGKAIRGRREKFQITTKVGLVKVTREDGSFGVDVLKLNRENIQKSVRNSLKELDTDFLDILQLHAYDSSTDITETLDALCELISEGVVRDIGVSNYGPSEIERLMNAMSQYPGLKISFLESHYNLVERMNEQSLLPACEQYGLPVVAYRGLARGVLSNKYFEGIPPDSRAASSWRVKDSINQRLLTVLRSLNKIALKFGLTLSEMSLSWLLSRKQVIAVSLGIRDERQLMEAASGSAVVLDPGCLELIESVIDGLNYRENIMTSPVVYLET